MWVPSSGAAAAMTNVSVPRGLVLSELALLVFAPLSRAAPPSGTPARVRVQMIDARGDASALLQGGDSVIVRVKGLDPRKGYDLALIAGPTDMVGLATAAADKDGEIEPLVLWYDSGITGPDPAGTGTGGDGFSDLRTAESYLQNHPLHVEVREADAAVPGSGPLVATAPLAVQAPRSA